MPFPDAPFDPDVISKSEFARRRNVTPPRVTQWIEARKIFGDAIVGEGRSAQIRESIACQQLNRTLDPSQRLGNGLGTRLEIPARLSLDPSAAGQHKESQSAEDGGATRRDPNLMTTQDLIAEQKLIQLRRQNERDRIEDAKARGDLVEAAGAQAQFARATAQLISSIEGKLSEMATSIAAEFKLPQRDLLHAIRVKFREARQQMANETHTRAADLPELVGFDLDASSDTELSGDR